MKYFSEEELKELETIFGLARIIGTLKVRDGFVKDSPDTELWWRGENGPEFVHLNDDHRQNCVRYPNVYQIEKPKFGGYID